jgi:hypothetical protein
MIAKRSMPAREETAPGVQGSDRPSGGEPGGSEAGNSGTTDGGAGNSEPGNSGTTAGGAGNSDPGNSGTANGGTGSSGSGSRGSGNSGTASSKSDRSGGFGDGGFGAREHARKASHYATLGVAEHASQRSIRDAYRRAVQRCHPDRYQDQPEAEAVFKEITAAYKVLKDPRTRRDYDRRLGLAPAGNGASSGAPDRGPSGAIDHEDVDAASLLRLETLAEAQGDRGIGAPKIASRLIAEGSPYQFAWHLAWRARRAFLARTLDNHATQQGSVPEVDRGRGGWQESRARHLGPLAALLGRLTKHSR